MRTPALLPSVACLAALLLACAARAGEEAIHLCDFEAPEDLKAWEFTAGAPTLVANRATHGARALEIVFDRKGEYHPAYMSWSRVRRDWSGCDALVLDVYNPNPEPIPATVLIADKAWADKGRSYWNRHNGATTFAPGSNRWVIGVGGLYRGEAGSRNNDIKRNIDADQIVRLDFGFGEKGAAGRVVIDDLRLIRVSRPAGVRAFDFGPENQSVQPGWTPVSHATLYTKPRGYGWGPAGGTPWKGADRDTSFGPPLLRDFCEAGGYRFRVDVPAGSYRVTAIYENCGYWGGEQAQHATRRILVNGREAWSETRPDGAAHALYRFEEVEPVGKDIWDTYMLPEVARPITFDAQAGADGLTLQFEADKTWGSKLSALVVHAADDADSAKWLTEQLAAVAAEFRAQAVCLDLPPPVVEPPAAWKALGAVAWPVGIEADVTPHTLPPAGVAPPDTLALAQQAARGEIATLCLAVRPVEALGACPVQFRWVQAPAALTADVAQVWYNTSRDFNTIAYHVRPHTLRTCAAASLARDVTRELILRIAVPATTPAGAYTGELALTLHPGAAPLRVPVRLRVAGVTLDRRTDFQMGFFGVQPPDLVPASQREALLDQTLALLHDYGMTFACGGPDFRLTGWKDGQPQIDFAEMDRFAALLRRHGFDGPLNGYGGPRFVGLHDGYEKGATAARVERESGLPYSNAFFRAWQAADAHARAANWPLIWYAMCDETRVRDVAERELEFMRLMASVTAVFSNTVRASGCYSVTFRQRPTDPRDMTYWHQRFFETLDISDLNQHDGSVMEEARRLGKEIHIYNQGTTRRSFGDTQWLEYHGGVRARTQWHLNVLHGYQFFDLDGREPDTAMLCYGRHGLYTTIAFERCREGAQDFYLYNALEKAVAKARQQGRTDDAVKKAERMLPVAGSYDSTRTPEMTKGLIIDALEALAR
jgi:hypothetical protein